MKLPFLKSLISVLVVYSSSLLAKDSSEYFYHLESAQNSLSLSYMQINLDMDIKSNNSALKGSIEAEEQKIRLAYQYGLTSDLNFLFNLSQTEAENTAFGSKSSSEGLEDIVLGLQYKDLLSTGALFYQANLNISLEDKETNSQDESNAFSGGHSLDLQIGYQFDYDIFSFGIALQKDLLLEDKTQVTTGNSSSETVSGGEITSLTVFSEVRHSDKLTSSYAFSYSKAEDTTTDNGSSTSSIDEINEFYTLTLALVAKEIGPGDLLAAFAYVKLKDDQVNDFTITKDNSQLYTLGYRITF